MVFFIKFPSPFWLYRLFSTLDRLRTGCLRRLLAGSTLPASLPSLEHILKPRSRPVGFVCIWTAGKHTHWILCYFWFALLSLKVGGFIFSLLLNSVKAHFINLNYHGKILGCLDKKTLNCYFVHVIFLKTHSLSFLYFFLLWINWGQFLDENISSPLQSKPLTYGCLSFSSPQNQALAYIVWKLETNIWAIFLSSCFYF